MTTSVLTIGLISTVFLIFVVLRTFSGSTRAYAVLSLVPLALGLTAFTLHFVSAAEHGPDCWWADLYEKVLWASTIQTALGIALIAQAAYRRRPLVLLMITTFVTGSLLWLRVARLM
jgi:hypothetical protein